jgi:putative ABC transport system permease protein
MFRDLRFAVRMFGKNPGTTAVAVISLAIAIGPNCALFSVVDRLFLRPYSVRNIERIFRPDLLTDTPGVMDLLSYPDLLDYQAQAGEVGQFAAADKRTAVVNSGGRREVVQMNPVSENYFSMLGVNAVVGRALRESDAHIEGPPPVAISYSLWQRQFGGTDDAVGKTLLVNGRVFSLVGIMPRGFRGPGLDPAGVWIPFSALPPEDHHLLMQRAGRSIETIVRLGDGVDKAHAETVLTTVARRLASQYPDTNKGGAVFLDSGPMGRGNAESGKIILSLAGLVILIACANITVS